MNFWVYGWAIAGLVFCLWEFATPTNFGLVALGLSAFLVAAIAIVIPNLVLQIVLWILGSALGFWGFRQLSSRRKLRSPRLDDLEARTLTSIPPGETGRVLYEGNSWQARCADPDLAIAGDQIVDVVREDGTTLIVLPRHLLS